MPNTYHPNRPILATSRRAISEEKNMLKQVLLLLGLFSLLLIFFFFIIVPTLIRLAGGSAETTDTKTDEVKFLRAPQLSAPPTATNSATLTLTGFAEKNTQVIALQNGNETGPATTQEDGKFSLDIELSEGDNRLQLFTQSTSNKDLKSPSTKEYIVSFDNVIPELEIISPSENQRVEGKKNQIFGINGQTEEGSKVFVNNRLASVKPDGSFSTTYSLGNGDNELTIVAIDKAGNTIEKKVKVHYQD